MAFHNESDCCLSINMFFNKLAEIVNIFVRFVLLNVMNYAIFAYCARFKICLSCSIKIRLAFC